MLDSKGRREILDDLVAEVRALIGEPLQNRNESVKYSFKTLAVVLHPLSCKVAKDVA